MANLTNVYLMQDGHSKLYKIGRSTNVMAREKTLLSQAPLTTLIRYWTGCPEVAEKQAHNRLRKFRRRGEWFELDDANVRGFTGWFSSRFRRVDVVPMDESTRRFVIENSFRWSVRKGLLQRYEHADFSKFQVILPPVPCSEMEWHNDGQFLDTKGEK